MDKIPVFVDHPVVVDIGEGTFAGFILASKIIIPVTGCCLLAIKGKFDNPILSSGSVSGTATAGSNIVLGDGRDELGRWVASGIYFSWIEIRSEADPYKISDDIKKMLR